MTSIDHSTEEDNRELVRKWEFITDNVFTLASELAESLRTIIEPTVATRLQYFYA